MNNLTGPWAGNIYGTNTGKVFIELEQQNERLTGTAHLNDDSFGVVVFALTGTDGDEIAIECTPEKVPEGIEVEPARIRGKLTPDGSIRGRWETDAGTAGMFVLFRHSIEASQAAKPTEPEQIYNRVVKLGSVRLFKDDVSRLLEIARKDFSTRNLIVTYEQDGNEITKWADDFLQGIDQLTQLRTLRLFMQEPGKGSINRQINIDLLETGESTVRVTGPDETWVVGKAESAGKALAGYQNGVVTNYKKYGLNMNFFLFVGMVILMPSISGIKKRVIFAAVVLALVWILFAIHSKLIPNTLVLIKAKPKGPLALAWPSILSWLLTVTSTVVAGLIFLYLTKQAP